jgi:hypothetical protein
VAADADTVAHYRYEESLQGICDSQKFNFGDNMYCSHTVVPDGSSVLARPIGCTHSFKCISSENFFGPYDLDDCYEHHTLVLPAIPDINIDASSKTARFPLQILEDCAHITEQLSPNEYNVVYENPGYKVNPLSHRDFTPWWAKCSIESIRDTGPYQIHMNGETVDFPSHIAEVYPGLHAFGRYAASLLSVIYENGTSIYRLSHTHYAMECVSRDQPKTCVDLYSKTPALVVEVGGVKALYPYQDQATTTKGGGVSFDALNSGVKDGPWKKYDTHSEPLLDIV